MFKMNHIKREQCVYIVLFFLSILFLSYIHPITLFDADDWTLLGNTRVMLPNFQEWNPSKILPEFMMPLSGYIAAYVIRPIVGDYIRAISLSSALIVSSFIIIYLYSFSCYCKSVLHVEENKRVLYLLAFLAFHFIFFNSESDHMREYLLRSVNLTCYFYYVIPFLLSAALTLFFIVTDRTEYSDGRRNSSYINYSILIPILYLAIFSNILNNIVLMSYLGSYLCYRLFLFITNGEKNHILEFIASNKVKIAIILVWIISLIFEAKGGRAHQIGHPILSLPVADTMHWLIQTFRRIHPAVYGFMGIVHSVWILCYICNAKHTIDSKPNFFIILMEYLSLCITVLYLVLICSKAVPDYIGSSEVFIDIAFWLLIISFTMLEDISKTFPRLNQVIPLAAFILIASLYSGNDVLKPAIMYEVSETRAYQVDSYIIEQIIRADLNGKESVNLIVPKGGKNGNWPFSFYMEKGLAKTLYKHGITSRKMDI